MLLQLDPFAAPDSKSFYYYSSNTGKSMWEKPRSLLLKDCTVEDEWQPIHTAQGVYLVSSCCQSAPYLTSSHLSGAQVK